MKTAPEIEPIKNNAFYNCKLGRDRFAKSLTKIIDVYPEGIVLALNNDWGAGKTTFVNMWKQMLDDEEYRTIYFNAWENDFCDDALTALVSELDNETLKNDSNNDLFSKIIKNGASLFKSSMPIVLGALIDKYVGDGVVKELSKNLSNSAVDIFSNELEEYSLKKKNLSEFKASLSEYLNTTNNNGKPLIYFIDELDRCRPNYAVQVLEKVKHLFSVKGIVFVLVINKTELEKSIKGVYNSNDLKADDYLKRFIDIEYSLPEPDTGKYSDYLFEFYSIDSFFVTKIAHFVGLVFSGANIPLRKQEKIVLYFKFAISSFKNHSSSFSSHSDDYTYLSQLAFILSYIKVEKAEFFNEIKTKSLKEQELVNKYELLFSLNSLKNNSIVNSLAILLYSYCQYSSNGEKLNLFKEEEGVFLKINTRESETFDSLSRQVRYLNDRSEFRYHTDLLKNLIAMIELRDGLS